MQINTSYYYNQALRNQQMAMLRASTAQKINSASDDAAGLAISEGLKSQYNGLNQASMNMGETQDLLNTAEGGMSDSSDILQEMRQLSLQAANGTLSDSDRADIQVQMNQLKDQLDSNANNMEFNGIHTNNGTLNNFVTQAGPNSGDSMSTSINDTSSKGLGVVGNVSTQADAMNTLSSIDKAINTLSSDRSSVGAASNTLDYGIQGADQASYNTQASYSNYRDADMANELTSYRQAGVQAYASMMAMSLQMQSEQSHLSMLV